MPADRCYPRINPIQFTVLPQYSTKGGQPGKFTTQNLDCLEKEVLFQQLFQLFTDSLTHQLHNAPCTKQGAAQGTFRPTNLHGGEWMFSGGV